MPSQEFPPLLSCRVAHRLPGPAALLPFTLAGERLGVRRHPPRLGEHTAELLACIGCSEAEVERLRASKAVG